MLELLARKLPSSLRVVVTDRARQRAHRRLGLNPPSDWWQRVAEFIKCGRVTVHERDGDRVTYLLPTDEGCELAVRVDERSFRGHVYEVTFLSVWLV